MTSSNTFEMLRTQSTVNHSGPLSTSSVNNPNSISPLTLLNKPSIALLAFTAFTLALDQNMSSPNLSDMAVSFALTPAERDARLGGLCMFFYFVLGGVGSLLVGGLKPDFTASLVKYISLIFSLANFYVALALPDTRAGFFSFLLCRLCAGAAFGGALPLVFALAAKETSEETLVSGLIGTAVSAGAAVGQVLNGLLPGWRTGYLLAGVSGVIASVGIHSTRMARPPSLPRGVASTLLIDFRLYGSILDTYTNKLIFIQSIFGNIAWSVIAVFLADFIHSELHYSKPLATLSITGFGLGGLLANIYGSKYGQALFNLNKKQDLVYLLSLPTIVGTLPMISLILLKPTSFLLVTTLLVASAVAAVPGPNLKGLLLAANTQETRAAAFSAFQLVEMLGKGCGPILVSALVWITSSRSLALALAVLGWAVSGAVCWRLRTCIERDTTDKNVVFTAYELPEKIEKLV